MPRFFKTSIPASKLRLPLSRSPESVGYSTFFSMQLEAVAITEESIFLDSKRYRRITSSTESHPLSPSRLRNLVIEDEFRWEYLPLRESTSTPQKCIQYKSPLTRSLHCASERSS